MVQFKFDKDINYIGATDRQKDWTKYMFLQYPDINFTAGKHDWHYALMLGERNQAIRFVMKVMYDLVFLVLGSFRCFKNFAWFGMITIWVLYIILLVSSPFYLWIKRKEFVDLSK